MAKRIILTFQAGGTALDLAEVIDVLAVIYQQELRVGSSALGIYLYTLDGSPAWVPTERALDEVKGVGKQNPASERSGGE